MSIWGLIASASIVVQLVMLTLVAASVLSWIVIFQRMRVLKKAKKVRTDFEESFWSSGVDLGNLYRKLTLEGRRVEGMESIFAAGIKEFTRLRQSHNVEPDAIMDGVQRAMRVALYREEEKLDQHLPFLATVGSTSPYIGLFGTVWGIMNSFIGLAEVQQATLAAVAPGIAEALIATELVSLQQFLPLSHITVFLPLQNPSHQVMKTFPTNLSAFCIVKYTLEREALRSGSFEEKK